MTDLKQAEKAAQSDAEWLLLMLLISKNVEFRSDVGRFYVEGKSVSITTIREYVKRIETRIGKRLSQLTTDLENGNITATDWREGFEKNITSAHILTAALALGSIKAAVNNSDVQRRINDELGYARKFGKKVKDEDAGTHKQIASRARSYLLAVAVTYGILEQLAKGLTKKFTECRRIRRASESCPGCIAYSYRWMSIDAMPAIGSLLCGSRCRCYLEYR